MNTLRTFVIVAALWSLALSAAVAGPPTEYSTTVVATSNGQIKTMKQYAEHGKMRTEMSQGGQTVISIVRPDKKVAWTILVTQKMYSEIAMSDQGVEAAGLRSDAAYVKVGNDSIDGKTAEKYRVDLKGKPVGFVWFAGKTPLQFKTTDDSLTLVYKDFKFGKQPASLFELPAGYRKMQVQKQP